MDSIIKFEKFVRYPLHSLSLGEIYEILTSPKYSLHFVVFESSGGFTRNKLPPVGSLDGFRTHIGTRPFTRASSGLDSGNLAFTDGDYLDCYR